MQRSDIAQTGFGTLREVPLLREVLDEHCRSQDIEADKERLEVARRLEVLWQVGLRTRERLVHGLDANRREDERTRQRIETCRHVSLRRHSKKIGIKP